METLGDQTVNARVEHQPNVRARYFKVCSRVIGYADSPVDDTITLSEDRGD